MFLKQSNIQIELEKEQNSSLPVLIQLIQNISRWDSLRGDIDTVGGLHKYNVDPQRPGTIGNYSYAFTIEVPNVNPNNLSTNFKTLYNMMTGARTIKISRRELFDKFYIFKLPDFGNQTMSIGMLDFVPFCYINGYKIGQDKIGMIRSFNTKEVYLIFDKRDSDNADFASFGYYTRHNGIIDKTKLLTVYINYKRYYANASTDKKVLPEGNFELIKLSYNIDTNRYEGKITTKFNKLTEESIRNISVYVKNLDNAGYFYKAMNSTIFKNIYINGINLEEEIASRQAERIFNKKTIDENGIVHEDYDIPRKERDFFKLVVETLYNVSKSYLYGNDDTQNGESPNNVANNSTITFDVAINNFLYTTDRNELYIGTSEYMTSSLLLSNIKNVAGYNFSETDQFDLYEKLTNTYIKLIPYEDYYPIYTGATITGFEKIVNDVPTKISSYEVIPHYDDRKRIEICKKMNVTGVNNYNIHKILKDDKIFKYNLDLSKCEIEIYMKGKRVVNTKPGYINLKTNKSLINLVTDFSELYDDSHNKITTIHNIGELRSEILNGRNIYLFDKMSEYAYFYTSRSLNNWVNINSSNSVSIDNSNSTDNNIHNLLTINTTHDMLNYNIEIIIKYDNIYDNDDICCSVIAYNRLYKIENTTSNIYNNIELLSDISLKYKNKYRIGNYYNYTILTDPTINVVDNKEVYDKTQSEQDFYLYHGFNKNVDAVLVNGEPRIYTNTVEDDTSESMRNKFIVSTADKASSENIISEYNSALTDVKTNLEYFYGYTDIPNDNTEDKSYSQQMQEKYQNLELSIKNIKDSIMAMYLNSYEDMIEYTNSNNITDRFMAIVFELDNDNPINLVIKKNNVIEKIEYSCTPRALPAFDDNGEPINKYYYIHLPYYFYNEDTSVVNLNYTLENNTNAIKSYQIMY